jgi:hypothetical protein
MVAKRTGQMRIWDLTERILPDWVQQDEMPEQDLVRRAVVYSLRALGVGRATHIKNHFIRSAYPGLTQMLKSLEQTGEIQRITVVAESGNPLADTWYIHREDLPLLDSIEGGEWYPRTTLLSPFDNLICDRSRTEQLFDFSYRIEIYVPPTKRIYGYYVLPILHGDCFIGRIDALFDRKKSVLHIHKIWLEGNMTMTEELYASCIEAVNDLGTFLGAERLEISFSGNTNVPKQRKW